MKWMPALDPKSYFTCLRMRRHFLRYRLWALVSRFCRCFAATFCSLASLFCCCFAATSRSLVRDSDSAITSPQLLEPGWIHHIAAPHLPVSVEWSQYHSLHSSDCESQYYSNSGLRIQRLANTSVLMEKEGFFHLDDQPSKSFSPCPRKTLLWLGGVSLPKNRFHFCTFFFPLAASHQALSLYLSLPAQVPPGVFSLAHAAWKCTSALAWLLLVPSVTIEKIVQ